MYFICMLYFGVFMIGESVLWCQTCLMLQKKSTFGANEVDYYYDWMHHIENRVETHESERESTCQRAGNAHPKCFLSSLDHIVQWN